MGKPDALSRRPDHGTCTDDNSNIILLPPEHFGPGEFAIQAMEGIQLKDNQVLLCEICKELQDGTLEDGVEKAARELRKSGSKSVRSAEWSESDGLVLF